MTTSLCCGAPPLDETDVCSACLEHAEFVEEDDTSRFPAPTPTRRAYNAH